MTFVSREPIDNFGNSATRSTSFGAIILDHPHRTAPKKGQCNATRGTRQ
jgi:hypothetical protein